MKRVDWRSFDWVLIVAVVGVILLSVFASLVYPPAGLGVAGAALVIWAVFLAPVETKP